MSFLSNKFKLEVKASEPHVARFISHTDKVNLKIVPGSENAEHCIFGIHRTSNYEASITFASSNTLDTVITMNDNNIRLYKDTIIGGNLAIDGYVITTGIDVMLTKEDLYATTAQNSKGKIDMTSNILARKQLQIIDRGISLTSNAIMQSIPSLSQKLFEDGLDVVSSNQETLEFLRNPYNYSIERFEGRFASKTVDELQDGLQANFFKNDLYTPDILIIQGDLRTSNIATCNIYCEQSFVRQYAADGSMLTNIYLDYKITDELLEGSNLFYKASYIGIIAAASNIQLSNYALSTFEAKPYHYHFNDTSNYIQSILVPQSSMLNHMLSELFLHASNYTMIEADKLQEPNTDTSNYMLYNTQMASNYLNELYMDPNTSAIYENIVLQSANISNYIENTSNRLSQQLLATKSSITEELATCHTNVELYMQSVYQTFSNTIASYTSEFMEILDISDVRASYSNQYVVDSDKAFASASNVILEMYPIIPDVNDNILQASNILIDTDTISSNNIAHMESHVLDYLYGTIPLLYDANKTTSNFLRTSSNLFVHRMNELVSHVLVYNTISSNELDKRINANNDNILAYADTKYDETNTHISTKMATLDTDKIAEGKSNFYYSDDKFDEYFSQLTLDNFVDGTSNQFIVNHKYQGNLHIQGTLYASNIFIENITSIYTNVYQTGSCLLDNLEITHDDVFDVFDSDTTSDLFVLYNANKDTVLQVKRDKVGLFRNNAFYDFDVSGITRAAYFKGIGNMTEINLDDRTTDHLPEGSNLYFTNERVAHLIAMSNINLSRLSEWIDTTNSDRLSYIANESNMIETIYVDTFAGNYASNAIKEIMSHVILNHVAFSNYVIQSSNNCLEYSSILKANVIDYVNETSNMQLFDEYALSNYIAGVYPNIAIVMQEAATDISNYGNEVNAFLSDVIDGRLVSIVANQSNYVAATCNSFFDMMNPVNRNLLNYFHRTSNVIAREITVRDIALQNYVEETVRDLSKHTFAILDNLNSNVGIYTFADIYTADKILDLQTFGGNNLSIPFHSTHDFYLYKQSNEYARQVTSSMSKEGFVIHFSFKAEQVYNTPIYYIGNNRISLINIKVLYGNVYLRLGYKGNSIRIFSTSVIKQNTWYTVDVVAFIIMEQISLKMYLNKVPENIILFKNELFFGSGLIQNTVYHDTLNYANLVIASEPAILAQAVQAASTNAEYYIVYTEGNYDVFVAKNVSCTIFMIGGGGGAGYNYGGGGGAGAYYYTTHHILQAGKYRFCIGSGGAGATEDIRAQNGEDTYIAFHGMDIIRCKGGGYGGSSGSGGAGGCGGGGTGWDNNIIGSRLYAGGANVMNDGIGFAGGSGYSAFTNNILSGGGGGGIGGVGQSANAIQKEGGNGGDGLIFHIKGYAEVYGGGGGGGEWATYTTNPAGLGGGAILNGTFVRVGGSALRNAADIGNENGKPHTGSGGGSGKNTQGGSGGSGVIIIRFSEDNDLSMYLGCSNILDVFEDNRPYSPGVAYTNTYFSSNTGNASYAIPSILKTSAANKEDFDNLIADGLRTSNYEYQYSSNIKQVDANYYDNHEADVLRHTQFILTQVYTNVRLSSGYYTFVLDLQNEVSADLAIGDFNTAFYYNPLRLNNPLADVTASGNKTTEYPVYMAEGYYKMHLRLLRTIANRNNNYFIAKYAYNADWQGPYYTLNNSNNISYVPFATMQNTSVAEFSHLYMMNNSVIYSTSNVYKNISNYSYDITESFYAGNRYSSNNVLSLQEFKIFDHPTMGSDYSINNILGVGKDNGVQISTGRVRANRWRETAEQGYIYYNEGNIGIGQTDVNASLEIFTKTSLNYSLKTNHPIWTNLGLISSSDERIKKNMKDVSDSKALENILKIEPKKYSYIDRDGSNIYGFIAQQIREVVPEAVSLQTSFIPNIYMYGVLAGNQITLAETSNLCIGDRVLILCGSSRYVENCVSISESINVFEIENKAGIHDGNVFVYGTLVEDFHTLDKSYIYTLNVCALQELSRRFEDMQRLYCKLQDIDVVETLKSDLEIIKENIERLDDNFDNAMIDKIELLRTSNNELMQRMNTCGYLVNSTVFQELDKLQMENDELICEKQKIMSEYDGLVDTLQNQVNEISTIKTIMQLNGLQ
jgi:hypothetical protein